MTGDVVIGVDFGTESARALLVDVHDGQVYGAAEERYRHGVMDQTLKGSVKLPNHWALQNPGDYLESLEKAIVRVVSQTGVAADRVVGIGIDFTACTILPVLNDGTPLCEKDEFVLVPHAYSKLWKHHAAYRQARRISAEARGRNEEFILRYGDELSSEWELPKILEILEDAPEVFEAADWFAEAGDWVVWSLVGRQVRNACAAGYKGCWDKSDGYPSEDFLSAIHPKLRHLFGTKVSTEIKPVGSFAGYLSESWAKRLGLTTRTAVAVGTVDAHSSVFALGANRPGQMVIVMGTSFCHMLLSDERRYISGIPGMVDGGIIPGLIGYESGQPAGGDTFGWFVDNLVPTAIQKEATDRNLSVHQVLTEKAAALLPGGTGLVALDWLNGNRSVLMNESLQGCVIGLGLQTTAPEIYRALLESVAFGTKVIIDTFERSGVNVTDVIASGGIASKNELFLQILADITDRVIRASDVVNSAAIGAAILGAVAAGSASQGEHGHLSMDGAIQSMARQPVRSYYPQSDAHEIYNELYAEYTKLHDFFGREHKEMMAHLQSLRRQHA